MEAIERMRSKAENINEEINFYVFCSFDAQKIVVHCERRTYLGRYATVMIRTQSLIGFIFCCLLSHHFSRVRAQCSAGNACINGFCSLCSPGTYQPSSIGCTVNPSPSNTPCLECPANSFQSNSGATGCSVCPSGGTTSPAGSVGCVSDTTLCPAGTYTSPNISPVSPYKNYCYACAVGYYNSGAGVTACSMCPPGTAAYNEGTVDCTVCWPGMYLCYLLCGVCF